MSYQVIVTSYQRPKYLKPTVDALLKQEGVEVIVVDGGSSAATRLWIMQNAHRSRFFAGNPGADFLKNVGMAMLTEPIGMLMSDDLLMPFGGVAWAFQQSAMLGPEWGWVACNMDYIEKRPPRPWLSVHGVDIMRVDTCQVSGAVMAVENWQRFGGFPRYGRTGEGDWALSKRMRDAGLKLGYLRRPVLTHLGARKSTDYAEYATDFEREQAEWYALARGDLLRDHPGELLTWEPGEIE